MLRKKFIGKTRDVFTTLSTSMEEPSCEKSERLQVFRKKIDIWQGP